ncbi:polysaccharide ABC transporter ATP-binding protein [Cognataquiflexum rubidum]|uniref:ABC transporter ATP-binding protein n=1 Tax=Cognataquiflexum rubidum TaxID=2922273 RepID=UPI001F139C08|nr:ABC transporter ATP-binding protein [Cognataquiflexum rubidum]MCH6234048.1 ABC transporter ATP-binding protein [Cognataquiflexum rubidum]
MSKVVISVEDLGKKYRLGSFGTGSLSQDLNQWWAKIRGKENALKIVDFQGPKNADNDEFWALENLNFEVNQGDILGIIGKNGAGKSTLLKILSRVTTPTLGEIKVKGRIASLLEVGTGFHPELTGRENIFLNGAIMGMTKSEIKGKLDEIIDFSGVERHIDTPVKRYSSGMYVRLAFAVAAHLEPEILIVDEVLAVGDAEFQKKCLGKMKEVSHQGRTILFVSHNMTAVKKLCSKGIVLKQGKISFEGRVGEAVETYLNLSLFEEKSEITWSYSPHAFNPVQITALRVIREDNSLSGNIYIHEDFFVEIEFLNNKEGNHLSSYFEVRKLSEGGVFSSANWSSAIANVDPFSNCAYPKGKFKSRMKIPGNYLNEGSYEISAWVLENISATAAEAKNTLTFNILDDGKMRDEYVGEWFGVVRPKLEWLTSQVGPGYY